MGRNPGPGPTTLESLPAHLRGAESGTRMSAARREQAAPTLRTAAPRGQTGVTEQGSSTTALLFPGHADVGYSRSPDRFPASRWHASSPLSCVGSWSAVVCGHWHCSDLSSLYFYVCVTVLKMQRCCYIVRREGAGDILTAWRRQTHPRLLCTAGPSHGRPSRPGVPSPAWSRTMSPLPCPEAAVCPQASEPTSPSPSAQL